MAVTAATRPRLIDEPVPDEILDVISGYALLLGGANVIMQLAQLPIGHGVAKSTVDSGRVDRHPLKRLRTTATFLLVAMMGTTRDRRDLRAEIARSHAPVHSAPGDTVAYNAFDPDLQRWVAACLYYGIEDAYRRMFRPPTREQRVRMLWHGRRLGATLQMPEHLWPDTPEAFDAAWADELQKIEMDALTREHLQGIATQRFVFAPLGRFGRPFARIHAPFATFATLGFLPEPFRDELGLPWSDRRQRVHDLLFGIAAKAVRLVPRPLRLLPAHVVLWDFRRRVRRRRPVV